MGVKRLGECKVWGRVKTPWEFIAPLQIHSSSYQVPLVFTHFCHLYPCLKNTDACDRGSASEPYQDAQPH